MPGHTFVYISPSNMCKDHLPWKGNCSCKLVKPSACILFSLKLSFDIPRASRSCQETADLSASPYVDSPLSMKYVFVKHIMPWTTFGISLFK